MIEDIMAHVLQVLASLIGYGIIVGCFIIGGRKMARKIERALLEAWREAGTEG